MEIHDIQPLNDFNWDEFEKSSKSQVSSTSEGYDEEPIFHQGIAIIKRNGKYGAIMVGGKEIIPPIYDMLTEFKDGLAEVEYKGEKRLLNLSGQIQVKRNNEYVFIPEKYDWGCDYNGDACIVEKSGKYGLLSDDFHELIEPIYNSIVEINDVAYLAIGEHKGIILSITPKLHYIVSDCLFSEKGVFLGAIVSLPEEDRLYGILDEKLQIVQPIENDRIDIKSNKFFVIQQKGKGVGLCTLDDVIISKGQYDRIEVLNEYFIVAFNRDKDGWAIIHTSLLNAKGICLVDFSGYVPFSVSKDGSVSFDRFKISPAGVLYFVLYKKINYKCEELGQYIVTPDFIMYEYIEPFNNDHFIVGKKNENGILRFGVVDSKGVTILPFEYSRLKILSKDFIGYSIEDENILDLKKDYNDKELEWLLYHTDYGRFGEKLSALSFGILNSEYKIICPPQYRSIKVVETSSSSFFQVSVNGYKWGIIDKKDKVVLPIKFDSVDFTDKKFIFDPIHEYIAIKVEKLLGVASNGPSWDSQRKQNRFDETGSFIVPLKDGKIISVSSTKYDWCDSFNDRGWAKVVKSGLSGKINIKGEVISLFDENLIAVPDCFDWAYDFSFGYAPVYKDGRWGIVDINWQQIIPCVYESIKPICEGFFKYKETASDALPDENKGDEGAQAHHHIKIPQYKYGIVNTDNVKIIIADYKDIWPIEGGFFKIERVVENTVREYDRFGIINSKGDIVIAPNYAEILLVKIEENVFWIVTQNSKKGVLRAGKPLILNIFDDIIVEDEIFACKANTYSKDKGILVKYNVNGEILIDCMDCHCLVPAEYDVAYHSDYGLIRVVKEGKWGLINIMNDVVVPPSYTYIDNFDGQFAKVGNTKNNECIDFPDENDIRSHVKNMKYGLIDTSGEIVLPLEYNYINKWDNGYYCVKKDNLYILLSPSLNSVFETERRMEKFDDRYILIEGDSTYSTKYGLIDYNGNEIIPTDEERCFSEIEVLKNGFLKVTYHKGEYGSSHIGILNMQGKTVFEKPHYCDDIILLDYGLCLIKCDNYGSPSTYSLANLQGKEILPDSYYEIKLVNDGMISLRNYRGWGLADIKGNIIIDTNYLDELVFENGVANIKVKGSSLIQKINKNGIVIVHNGKNEIDLPDSVYWGTDFINRVSVVRGKGSGYNVIGVSDIKGNIIIPTRYKSVSLLSNKTIRVQDGDCYGIFDLKGNVIFPPIFTSIEYLDDNCIKVIWNLKIATKWDKNDYVPSSDSKYKGYDNDYLVNNRSAICNSKAEIINDKEISLVGKFVNGYARAYKEVTIEKGRIQLKQTGVVDTSGKTIIPLIYDGIIIYEDSPYIRLRKNGKYGIASLKSGKQKMFNELDIKHLWDIDKLGRCIYSEDCEYDSDCEDWIGGTRGVLNLKGVLVPTGRYHNIALLDNGLIKVSNEKEDLYGLLDNEGNEVLPIKYSYISSFKGDIATICINGKRDDEWPYRIRGGKWGVIDSTGKFLKECVSDNEEILEEKECDRKQPDIFVQFEEPSVVLTDRIPEREERNSYDYGYDSYYDDGDDDGPYSKYGGYNGWDDNTIDEAFDGNPELTWNID